MDSLAIRTATATIHADLVERGVPARIADPIVAALALLGDIGHSAAITAITTAVDDADRAQNDEEAASFAADIEGLRDQFVYGFTGSDLDRLLGKIDTGTGMWPGVRGIRFVADRGTYLREGADGTMEADMILRTNTDGVRTVRVLVTVDQGGGTAGPPGIDLLTADDSTGTTGITGDVKAFVRHLGGLDDQAIVRGAAERLSVAFGHWEHLDNAYVTADPATFRLLEETVEIEGVLTVGTIGGETLKREVLVTVTGIEDWTTPPRIDLIG